MKIGSIIEAIRSGRVRISDHADEEARADGLSLHDVLLSVFAGEIIEDYPEDTPYPSCLIYGRTPGGLPMHSVWAHNPRNQWVVLITVYRPDPQRWVDWRTRRPRDGSV